MGFVMGIFGVLSLTDGIATHFLPETKDKQMPDTLQEAENLTG